MDLFINESLKYMKKKTFVHFTKILYLTYPVGGFFYSPCLFGPEYTPFLMNFSLIFMKYPERGYWVSIAK